MLKPYHVRQIDEELKQEIVATVFSAEPVNETEENISMPGCSIRLTNSQVLASLDVKLEHLTPQQRSDVSSLLTEYNQLFSDIPGKTDVVSHDVDVGKSEPIKQHPYRCGPLKQGHFNETACD